MSWFSISHAQNLDEFEKYYKTKFKKLDFPIETKAILEVIGKSKGLKGKEFDFQEFYKYLLKDQNNILKGDSFVNINHQETGIPIGYTLSPDGYVFLYYLILAPYENDNMSHQLWVKSFSDNGLQVDSLVIDCNFKDEGLVRKWSRVANDYKIRMNQYLNLSVEEGENVNRKNVLNFSSKNGRFHLERGDIYFDREYYFSQLNDLLIDLKNDCKILQDSIYGDINFDNRKDIVCLLLKKGEKRCGGVDYELLLGINDGHGIMKLAKTLGSIDLKSSEYTISHLSINNQIISFLVSKKGNDIFLLLDFKYDDIIKNWKLIGLKSKNSISGEEDFVNFDADVKIKLISSTGGLVKGFYKNK